MGTFTPYKESKFASIMKRIIYTGSPDEDVIFWIWILPSIQSPGDDNIIYTGYQFQLGPSGEYIFDVGKMLAGIKYFKVSDFIGQKPFEVSIIQLYIQEKLSKTQIARYFFTGNIQNIDNSNFPYAWLTIKPQTFWTTDKSPLPFLGFINTVNSDDNCYCYLAKVYFRSESPRILCIDKFEGKPNFFGSLQYIDCSYSKVKAAAVENGLNDSIIAYDIYPVRGTEEGNYSESDAPLIPPQRFILRKGQGDWKSFVFANSIGGVDTVISTGRCKTLMSGDVYAFMNDGVEREQRNDAREQVEVNSGYIDSEALRKLWYEFFKSSDRCVADPDGTLRNIIVDEYKCEYTVGELSSFTFKYHYAEQQAARLEDRTELDDYYIG